MQIIFSFHARQRMLQRDINKSTVIEILKNPDFVEDSFAGRKVAVKKLDKVWRIVFVEEQEKIVVIIVRDINMETF